MENNNEQWRPVPGYEGRYMVSNQGRVMSLKTRRVRTPDGVRLCRVKYILKPFPVRPSAGYRAHYRNYRPSDNYYTQVQLYKDGTDVYRFVHRLVAEAFLGTCPEGLQVDHINGRKADNRLCNLCYVTARENSRRAVANGLRSQCQPLRITACLELPFTDRAPSVRELARRIGTSHITILKHLRRQGYFEFTRGGIHYRATYENTSQPC